MVKQNSQDVVLSQLPIFRLSDEHKQLCAMPSALAQHVFAVLDGTSRNLQAGSSLAVRLVFRLCIPRGLLGRAGLQLLEGCMCETSRRRCVVQWLIKMEKRAGSVGRQLKCHLVRDGDLPPTPPRPMSELSL